MKVFFSKENYLSSLKIQTIVMGILVVVNFFNWNKTETDKTLYSIGILVWSFGFIISLYRVIVLSKERRGFLESNSENK